MKMLETILTILYAIIVIGLLAGFCMFFLSAGDINNDGQITITDYTLLKLDLLGKQRLSVSQSMRADVNHDGYVDVNDLEIIRERILK